MQWGEKDGARQHEGVAILRVLVTGVTGFVGKALCTQAVRQGFAVSAALRKPEPV